MSNADSKPRFLEFFAGGGLTRLGLDGLFSCVFANDFDKLKAKTYRENFGGAHFSDADVWTLSGRDLPDAELAWASFPCQDLSLAGARKGLNAPRSGAFWGFWRLIETLEAEDRAPQTLALENVAGLISSRGGRDLSSLTETLANAGYRVGALLADAALFSPQSRPRLFIIAHKGRIPEGMEGGPDPVFHPPALQNVVARMDPQTRLAWCWWRPPHPPARTADLEDVLDRNPPASIWRSEKDLDHLTSLMAPQHLARMQSAIAEGEWRAGAVYRRIRIENGERVQRAEIRYDGLAGCLRTPGGGSSKQLLVVSEHGKARLRPLTAREAARLMGAPEDYILPLKETPALQVVGDAVSAPVVRWLGTHILSPLVAMRQASAKAA